MLFDSNNNSLINWAAAGFPRWEPTPVAFVRGVAVGVGSLTLLVLLMMGLSSLGMFWPLAFFAAGIFAILATGYVLLEYVL